MRHFRSTKSSKANKRRRRHYRQRGNVPDVVAEMEQAGQKFDAKFCPRSRRHKWESFGVQLKIGGVEYRNARCFHCGQTRPLEHQIKEGAK